MNKSTAVPLATEMSPTFYSNHIVNIGSPVQNPASPVYQDPGFSSPIQDPGFASPTYNCADQNEVLINKQSPQSPIVDKDQTPLQEILPNEILEAIQPPNITTVKNEISAITKQEDFKQQDIAPYVEQKEPKMQTRSQELQKQTFFGSQDRQDGLKQQTVLLAPIIEAQEDNQSQSSSSDSDSSDSSSESDKPEVKAMSFEKSDAVVKVEDNQELVNSQFSGRTFRIEPSEILSGSFNGIEQILASNFLKKCQKSDDLGEIVTDLISDIDRVKRKGSFINRKVKDEPKPFTQQTQKSVSPRNLRPRKVIAKKIAKTESKKSSQSSKKSSQKNNRPKRAMSNYNYFYKETQKNLRVSEPEIQFKQYPKKISQLWKNLEVSERKKYTQMQQEELARYQEKSIVKKESVDPLNHLKSLVKSEQIYKNIKNIKIKQEEEKITHKDDKKESRESIKMISSNDQDPTALVKQEHVTNLTKSSPKVVRSAFHYFYKIQLKIMRQSDQNISQLDAAYILSDKFRKLSPKDKEIFENRALVDKEKLLEETKLQNNFDNKKRKRDQKMETKILVSSRSSQSSENKLSKSEPQLKLKEETKASVRQDPNVMPRKALTAYQIFTRDMMKTMKDDPRLQRILDPKKRCQELMKITSQTWKTIECEQKKIFQQKSELDLQRHRNQLNQFQMLGYFILENGQKSTEIANPKIKGDA